MNLLTLFRSKKADPGKGQSAVECAHVVLAPRWDSVADIGHEEKAIGFVCSSCGKSLSTEEASAMRK